MSILMKVLDHQTLVRLNNSSIRAGRRQNIKPELMPSDPTGKYVVNLRVDHELNGKKDVRMSVILRPGVLTAWLDVSPEEYASIQEVQMTEVEWEAAMCVGMPPWTD